MASGEKTYVGKNTTADEIIALISDSGNGVIQKEKSILQSIAGGLNTELRPPIAMYTGMSTKETNISGKGLLFIEADYYILPRVKIDGVRLPVTVNSETSSNPCLKFAFNTSIYIPPLITGSENDYRRGSYVVLLF